MHLPTHLSFRIFMKTFLTLVPRAYVTYYQDRGLSGHTSPCGERACFLKHCTFLKGTMGTLHREKKYFFSRAPCILRTTYFFDVSVDQLSFELVKTPLQLFGQLSCLLKTSSLTGRRSSGRRVTSQYMVLGDQRWGYKPLYPYG